MLDGICFAEQEQHNSNTDEIIQGGKWGLSASK